MRKLILLLVSACLVATIGVMVSPSVDAPIIEPDNEVKAEPLPNVGTTENLVSLLKNCKGNDTRLYLNDAKTADTAESVSPTNNGSGGTEHSATNVQVEGVDEADIVKTDGKYIYQVNEKKVVITKAYPAKDMSVVKELTYSGDDNDFYPHELYVDDNYLIVLGTSYHNNYDKTNSAMLPKMFYYPREGYATAYIYSLKDYSLARTIEIEGSYTSSRKVGSSVYLLSNKYIYSYVTNDTNGDELVPQYRDTAVNSGYQAVDLNCMCYFPGFLQSSYLIMAGFNLDNMTEKATISSYLGAGSEIYATESTLYVTQSKYNWYNDDIVIFDSAVKNEETVESVIREDTSTTSIYKFKIKDGAATYTAKGEVPGTIINQFSMDEYEDNFRIATTTGQVWDETSKNNLYVLDNNLKQIGKLEGLAKGEKIYSVRFMGDKCYMVTYKNVDPLFVIDISKPSAPAVLGELKIPGYSDYLHPYGDHYLIGIGKDTIVKTYKDWEGNLQETAYEVGLKMALFDVSDFNNPKELHTIRIGDRGSYSEVLYNHKALLFDEEKNIIAFPATVTKSEGEDSRGVPNYGSVIFEGAVVYGLDLDKGFELRAKISHKSDNSEKYYYSNSIQRILYINDILYTTSYQMIKANSLIDFTEINSLDL